MSAPPLSADIAGLIRALDDRELLALCAPELRCRLGLAGRPFPEPRRRDRLLRKLRRSRVIQRHERRPARWRDSEDAPAPAPVVLEDLGPLEDGPPSSPLPWLTNAELEQLARLQGPAEMRGAA